MYALTALQALSALLGAGSGHDITLFSAGTLDWPRILEDCGDDLFLELGQEARSAHWSTCGASCRTAAAERRAGEAAGKWRGDDQRRGRALVPAVV